MAAYTIYSWCYYNIGTIIATGAPIWLKQAISGGNPGYTPATYTEFATVDTSMAVNEALHVDYGGGDATYLGTITNSAGQVFVVIEDGYGQLLGSTVPNVPYANWPAEFLPSEIAAVPTTMCFLTGTEIETPDGPRTVESLRIGDEICTATGQRCAVKWVGQQSPIPFAPDARQQPVCIQQGALGDGLPYADLTVTADHGMIIDGLVINAAALVNGTTIDWVPAADLPDQVTYYHIETEAHDVILANGAASETFVDAIGRAAFDNYSEYLELYGAERIIPEMDRPRITTQRLLPDAIKARLGIVDAAVELGLTA